MGFALIALSLLDVLALAVTQTWPADPHVHVRSRTDLYVEHGREAGGWRVVAVLSRTGGGVRLDGQLIDHAAHIEPGERVVAVDAPWSVVAQPVGEDNVMLSGAWDVRTGRGNGYRGVTVTVAGGLGGERAPTTQMAFSALQIGREDDGQGEIVRLEATLAASAIAQTPV